MNNVKMIPVWNLHPHPDNPRKEIGDITSLANSIKEQGVMQNLTVIPAPAQGVDNYTVLIGHRRLAAAKKIGLTELPCVIVKLNYKQQLAVMMAENMQRTDLTLPEQVQGIQMMLDLDETVADISAATGLSESTVRNRKKLTKLDTELFETAYKKADQTGQQINITDWLKIAEIEDEHIRNDVMSTIGTNNFNFAMNNAKLKENITKNKSFVISQLSKFAERISEHKDDLIYEKHYGLGISNIVIEHPHDDKERYYIVRDSYITVYVKSEKEEQCSISDNQFIEQNNEIIKLKEQEDTACKCRHDFVKNALISTEQKDFILFHLIKYILSSYHSTNIINIRLFEDLSGIDTEHDEEIMDFIEQDFETALLTTVYTIISDYHKKELYDMLKDIEYQMSDFELQQYGG